MSKALYLYCIVDSPEEFKIDLLGIDNEHQPYIISFHDVGVLVSQVYLKEYGQEELERKVRDLEWLQKKADRHEAVIERVMETNTVIPVTFGTIFKKVDKLKAVVTESLSEVREIFKLVEGHEEWGLKLYCDFSQLEDNISELSPEIKELEEKLEDSDEGTAYFLKRRLEIELDKELEDRAFEVADKVYKQLSALATEFHLNEILDLEISEVSKPMLLNSVYLVNKEKLADFLLKLKELEKKYYDFGFYFYYSGPWPPYNFSKFKLKGRD